MTPPNPRGVTRVPEFDVVGFIRQLEARGPAEDARPGLDTESLVRADPTLASVAVEDVSVSGLHGDAPVRIYCDRSRRATAGLVWVHGGGFVGGSLDMPEAHWVSLYIASRGVPVASVDYRKALHGIRYPIPLEDVSAAWLWVAGEERPLGDQIEHLHLGGASAGATLATGATQRMRDEGLPMPTSLLLAYPLLHAELPELSAEIVAALATNPPPVNFTPAVVKAFNANYIGEPAREARYEFPGEFTTCVGKVGDDARYAFPGEIDIRGLPPVLIVNAEADEMRASGERFARQLAESGQEVACRTQVGSQHGFLDQPNDAHALDAMQGFLAHMDRLS